MPTLDPKKKKKKNTTPKPAQHQVYHYLDIAKRLGAEVEEEYKNGITAFFSPPPLVPRKTPEPLSKPRIALCPGAEFGPAKRWTPEQFAETIAKVHAERPCDWVFVGVKGDAPVGEEILAALKPHSIAVINQIGKTSLAELFDELAQCDLLLSNDTGTMHLAAALGLPTVAIFGSTEPRLTGPLGFPRGVGHVVLRHQVECSPCFLRDCPLDFRCMKAISADEASAAVLTQLSALRQPTVSAAS